MIEIRKYEAADYLTIKRRDFELLTFLKFPDPKIMAQSLARGPGFTGLADGEIIACGGILLLWKGVGEAWVVGSELINLYRLTFAKTIFRKFKGIIKNYNFERVQTTIDVDNKLAICFAEWLGFKYEGLMRKYINGHDFYRYAWIKEED